MAKAKITDLEKERKELIRKFTKELPVLRVKLKVTQDALSNAVGISRQTYTNGESKRKMSWHVFLLLYFYFDSQERTKAYLQTLGDFTNRVRELLKTEEARGLLVKLPNDDTKN